MLTQAALLKAIKYCDSKQRKLAEMIGEDPDKISYWLNRARQIPFHHAIAIEMATQGLVSRYDLAPYARVKNKRNLSTNETKPELTLSERGAIGIALEKLLGNRRGVRSGKKKSPHPEESDRRKCAPLRGKTSALVAKEAGFSSRDTYLRVKKVIQHGIDDLIQAMDKKNISIAVAATISALPEHEQENLLKKDKKDMIAAIKGCKKTFIEFPEKSKKFYFLNMMKEKKLIIAEKNYRLPLRIPLLGIISCCDATGHFPWQPQQLRDDLLPHTELNFNAILETLTGIGLIRKINLGNQIIGRVLMKNLIAAR